MDLLQTNESTKIEIAFSSNAGTVFIFGRTNINKTVCMVMTCSTASSLGNTGVCTFSDMVATMEVGTYFMGVIIYVPEWIKSITFKD